MICFKMKKILDFNVHGNFQPIWTCLATLLKKKRNFPCLNSRSCFCCHYGILRNNDFWLTYQSILRRAREITLCMVFTRIFSNKKKMRTRRFIKQILYQGIFDFTEIVNNHGLKRGIVCQIMMLIPYISLKLCAKV